MQKKKKTKCFYHNCWIITCIKACFLSIDFELVVVNGNNYFNHFMVFIVKLAEIRTTARLLEMLNFQPDIAYLVIG